MSEPEAEQEAQELGITESKEHSTGEWYAEVVQKAELADYAPMGGFIVTRPRGYDIWERIKAHLDGWFKDTGVTNAYFPLFIPESYLEREKDIVEGFDPEVAWVTHGGHDELEERLAVRPTSESIIAPFMAQWTRSHRDLPLRLNQWCSVVRWEATETKPFFRTKEFLWQEGHTAHHDGESAWEETLLRLDQYERVYEEVLAIPVLKGRKPPHDKFPGAETTTTVEALMPDGKSVQGGTSHYLGTSFADAFDLTYVDEDEEERTAHTTSWGLSWRAMGALVMTHSDDQGLVLPPTLADPQVVVVPIWGEGNQDEVLAYAGAVESALDAAGVRVHLDDRTNRNPGFKYNEWELKGVPLRIEVGPNELADGTATLVHRPDGETATVDAGPVGESETNDAGPVDETETNDAGPHGETAPAEDGVLGETVADHLDTIYAKLYASAEATLDGEIREAGSREEILGTIGKHGGYVRAGWCGDEACEDPIKEAIAAEIAMVPMDDDEPPVQETCAICGDAAAETAYFAKTY